MLRAKPIRYTTCYGQRPGRVLGGKRQGATPMKRLSVIPGWRLASAGPLALIVALLVGLLAPGIASAHAYMVGSDPAAGSTIKAAPSVVTVHFAEGVNPQGSDLIVYDVTGK